MTEILSLLASPRAFAIALLLLLVAPGLLVRCLVRIYPRDDPRRSELLAEVRAVPVSERPFWVLEQVETVLVDGLPSRVRRLRQRQSQRRSLRARLLASSDAPVVTAGAIAVAVFVLFELLMAMTWGMGLAIIFVPFVLLLPALPLVLLVLLAIHRRQRMRRQGLR